ncbi:hypothetical protein Hanom_Chr04g00317911 [Helianthus anomalus]
MQNIGTEYHIVYSIPIRFRVFFSPEQPGDTEQQFVDPPKRRGPNLNLSVNRTLKDLPEGSKIPLRIDEHTISFIGTSATDFATECGIIMRNFCPMNYHI